MQVELHGAEFLASLMGMTHLKGQVMPRHQNFQSGSRLRNFSDWGL